MTDNPKLHGWITPEYAVNMIADLTAFLRENGYMVWAKWHWPTVSQYSGDIVFREMVRQCEKDMKLKHIARQICPYTTMSALNAE